MTNKKLEKAAKRESHLKRSHGRVGEIISNIEKKYGSHSNLSMKKIKGAISITDLNNLISPTTGL